MITQNDVIPIMVTDELPRAGCVFACRGLFHAADYERASRPTVLRQAAAQGVIELALQRYLVGEGIPFYQEAVTPFTAPDHASLVLGGRVCQVVVMLNEQVAAGKPGGMQASLEAGRLPRPAERGLPDAHEDEELLIYAAVTWRSNPPGQAEMVVHPMPAGWGQPQAWAPWGEMQVKSASSGRLALWLEGQDELRQYVSETVTLEGETPQTVPAGFYALAALRAAHPPQGRVGILRKGINPAYVVYPHQWMAVWHAGNEIRLLGYLSRGEARRMRPHRAGAQIPLTRLHPLGELFEKVKAWAGG